jgi:signal transduction histidine kinase
VVAAEDRERVLDSFRRILKRELLIIKDLEYRHLNRKGEDHLISMTIYPEKDQFGRLIGVEGVGRDITEKKRLKAELEKTKDLALLGEFSGAIAHQIRNPISNILMGTKLLKRAVGLDICESGHQKHTPKEMSPATMSRDNLSVIFRNLSDGIYNLNQVVTELVEYTKTLKPRQTHQRIDNILNETLASLEDMITPNGIHVKKYFEATLPDISVDAVLIGQVFRNLIHNATQAMSSGGSLFVTAGIYRQKPDYAIISIGDTGIGIESGDIEKIFHPFYTTKESGTGLGLSLAHRIIDAHGGEIWACPNPSPHQIVKHPGNTPVFPPLRQGLTFHILLPMDN